MLVGLAYQKRAQRLKEVRVRIRQNCGGDSRKTESPLWIEDEQGFLSSPWSLGWSVTQGGTFSNNHMGSARGAEERACLVPATADRSRGRRMHARHDSHTRQWQCDLYIRLRTGGVRVSQQRKRMYIQMCNKSANGTDKRGAHHETAWDDV